MPPAVSTIVHQHFSITGARILARKAANLLTSLPKNAEVLLICVPASCIPSPESPQKRTTTFSSSVARCAPLRACLGCIETPTAWPRASTPGCRRERRATLQGGQCCPTSRGSGVLGPSRPWAVLSARLNLHVRLWLQSLTAPAFLSKPTR